jgi:hypothetical protein
MTRALFVGGTVDNSELDLDGPSPPVNYPPNGGTLHGRYRLYEIGKRDGDPVYAVYAAPDLSPDVVERVIDERDYPRRFAVQSRHSPS